MGMPVISSFEAVPAHVTPGSSAQFVLEAFDSDQRVITGKVEVTDVNGNKATASTTLTVGDPLNFVFELDDPKGEATWVADPHTPGVWHVAVPA